MKKNIFIILFIFSSTVWADIFDVPKVQKIFNKKYEVKDEITAQLGYLPKGAFSKYLGVGASYTHAFSYFTSWEVINAIYTYELMASLKRQLQEPPYSFASTNFASQTFQVTSNIVFSPIYTKNLLFNSSIVYSQFSFAVGAGVAYFNLGLMPCIDSGLIFRFFLPNQNFLKFDLRYNKYLTTNQAFNDNFTIMVGYSFNLSKSNSGGEFGD